MFYLASFKSIYNNLSDNVSQFVSMKTTDDNDHCK